MPNSPIKTRQDMKGKKFGISNPKSLGEMMGVLVMEKAGLKKGDVQMTRARQPGRRADRAGERRGRRHRDPVILFRTRGGESKYRVLVGPKELPLIPSQLGMATSKAMKKNPRQAARHPGGAP